MLWTLPQLEQLQPAQVVRAHTSPLHLERRALVQEAETIGAQGGLAWETQRINQVLRHQSQRLDKIFNFAPLMEQGGLLPPVLIKGHRQAHYGPDLIRTARAVYRIVQPASFHSVIPNWRSTLIRHFRAPGLDTIPPALLPHNGRQRQIWDRAAALGWGAGVAEAHSIYRQDLARLTMDLTGMIQFQRLLNEGKVSTPVMAVAHLGIERGERLDGEAQRMAVGVAERRITRPAGFQSPRHWRVLPR
ncbi:type IV secretory system conjugative DNA transfer family protein [Acidithiobacillus thiooxidans]|uniref:type IV secretory system conjugative DNA transfer family protein n=1 Tax=Acidithiobacillus thiooxidans TaxID=930 RepID=UPI001C070DEF|nr:type IV secretory system conjugative DNA transfer family protein [Acidithiobacillus thiooxidans]MBU2844147.1 type IV secretion system DotC family protein [Acidithiobacillus thiooxidans]